MAFEKGNMRRLFNKVATGLLALGLFAGIGAPVYKEIHQQEIRVTVTGEHHRLLNENEGFGFRKTIYETDKGSLSNTLNPLAGKFSRGGIEKQIEIGKTYDVKVTGFNLPFFNIYRNIISAAPVQPGK